LSKHDETAEDDQNRRIKYFRLMDSIWNKSPDFILCMLVERRVSVADLDWMLMEARAEDKPNLAAAVERAYAVMDEVRRDAGFLDGM
jgi:hypothetical protein